MTTWQPPIPAGALYSRPARNLGPALALLAWCYDAVKRDGWCDVQLKDVAAEMDEPYHTIVKWWAKVSAGPFFTEQIDRGRLGLRVKFAENWIEWRVVAGRASAIQKFEVPEMVIEEPEQPDSIAAQVPELAIEEIEAPLNNSSITDELPEMVIEASAYKVLHADQKTHVARSSRKRSDAPSTPPEVRQAIASGSAIDLNAGLKTDVLQVNTTAAKLWKNYHADDQPLEAFVADIRFVGRWIRKTQYPYKDSEQRIPPSALIKFWQAAISSRKPVPAMPMAQAPPATNQRKLTPQEAGALARQLRSNGVSDDH